MARFNSGEPATWQTVRRRPDAAGFPWELMADVSQRNAMADVSQRNNGTMTAWTLTAMRTEMP